MNNVVKAIKSQLRLGRQGEKFLLIRILGNLSEFIPISLNFQRLNGNFVNFKDKDEIYESLFSMLFYNEEKVPNLKGELERLL